MPAGCVHVEAGVASTSGAFVGKTLEEPDVRRMDQLIRFRSCELDAGRRRLLKDGKEAHVTPKAFELLLVLVDEAPRVVSKRDLHARLWPRVAVSDWTLFSLIKELRRALDDSDPEASVIRTVHRVGYAFNATLEQVTPRPRHGRRWLVIDGGRFGLAVGENVVGRDPEAEVTLDDTTVSRRHARIVVSDSGAVIEDLRSKNGTSVGGARVRERVALHDGDKIAFGDLVALYRESKAGQTTVSRVGIARPR
jgi:DNA-binding winged helix-turn-helix (wHTH) protein